MHTNIYGPFNVQAHKGYEYFITFTDNYSRCGYVYLMHRKSDALNKLKEFKDESENQLSKHLKALRSDWGSEYMSNEFDSFLKEHEIISQLTIPRTSQKNGVVERGNRTPLDMVKSMMSFSTLHTSFWGYALETTGYFLNVVPSKWIPLTPMEMSIRCKPGLHHIHIWGCPTHVLKPKVAKLEPRSKVCQFIRY